MSSMHSRSRAVRLFASELAEATQTLTFSNEEEAPQYQLLPSGGLANRVFVVGTVTEIEDVGTDSEYWKARVVDPNGDAFFVYAGQYQPEAANTLRALEPPAYVAVVGKPQTFESDESIYVSIDPESVRTVDEQTRDRWVVETAEQTLDRIKAGLDGADTPGEAVDADLSPFTMAVEEYGQEVIEQVRQRATAAVATLQADGSELDEPAPRQRRCCRGLIEVQHWAGDQPLAVSRMSVHSPPQPPALRSWRRRCSSLARVSRTRQASSQVAQHCPEFVGPLKWWRTTSNGNSNVP